MAGEKSNYFTNLILELSTNKTDEDRENSRTRLQHNLETRDSRLSEMVKENRENISNSVKLCSSIIHTVAESRTRCRELKDRITRCMDMLECNRDNIRRMWMESLEHQYAHKILSEIEDLRAAPKKVKESLVNKKLEHATEVIVASIKLLDGNLCNAEALKDLKLELHNLQEKLYSMVLEDLRKNLHLTDFFADHYGEALNEATYEDIFSVKICQSDFSFKELVNQVSLDQEYITVLLNSVKTMKRLPETLEFLKENCHTEFTALFHEVSKLMNDVIERSADMSPLDLSIEKQHIFLIDLVENLICILQKILSNYKNFFGILENIVQSLEMTDIDFQIEDVYSKLQVAVETCLSVYFESNTLSFPKDSVVFENSHAIGGINVFFSSHDLSEDKSLPLFKFSNSFHGINMKKFSTETKLPAVTDPDMAEEIKQPAKPVLICRPALKNIIVVYNLLKSFVAEIEQSLNLSGDDHCPLYAFLHDSANLFLDHINSDINRTLKSAYANLDAWNTTPIGNCSGSKSGPEKEVLSCSLILQNILKEIKNLMSSLPDYSTHFLRLLYFVILEYKDMYLKAFKQMFEEEQNILSVSWARDRDIRRLMKSFLNWRHLEDDDAVVDVIESPEEIRLRNKEESELLIRNLLSEDEKWEIITDKKKLSKLALLQENLIWFSVELLKFIKNFNQMSQQNVQPATPSSNAFSAVSGLRKVIKEYEDFADMCLLTLHLEVRARCFNYLLTFSTGCEVCENFTQNLDVAVKNLTSDLMQIDEVLQLVLTPKEFKYVFEGLGELVASLMILFVSNLGKINEAVVSRIDRDILVIQCCLTNITMAREVSLERARQFIDLLKLTPEEILDQIVEEGPRFNREEYLSIFRLISSGGKKPSRQPEYYAEKLNLIFERLAAASARENSKDLQI